MPIDADVLKRRETHFVLWRPLPIATPPELLIGQLRPGNPPIFAPNSGQPFTLQAVPGVNGLWQIAAAACQLTDGEIYHYWFRVVDSRATGSAPTLISVTDPFAFTVDWRLFPPDTP